ncbi:MAG: excisionase family DNA-binding protein [Dehalococcoidia bacterium]|jgi:excisionase family DNA binding protein|nr:excisionase family DNA-binding protein [Dehalococcoidia bacterium]
MSSVMEELTEVISAGAQRRDGMRMSDQATAVVPASGWMTLLQASEHLGAHTNTVRRWVDSGAIGSYRTLGGHRRVAQGDVEALASDGAAAAAGQLDGVTLDETTVELIESTLRGEVSGRECRLRLRTLGHERGRTATSTGTGMVELLAEHGGVRRAIAHLVGHSGESRVSLDEHRRWTDGLADALLMGISEGIDTIPERAGSLRMRRTQ